jgi:hypothetical protein
MPIGLNTVISPVEKLRITILKIAARNHYILIFWNGKKVSYQRAIERERIRHKKITLTLRVQPNYFVKR